MSDVGPPLTRRRAASVGGQRMDRRERRKVSMESGSSSRAFSPPLTRKNSNQAHSHKRKPPAAASSAQETDRSKSSRKSARHSASNGGDKRSTSRQQKEHRDYLINYMNCPSGARYNVNLYARVIGIRRYRTDDSIRLCFQDDFSTMESRNGASSSEPLEKLRVGEDALYSVNEPLLTRTFPGNCFDVILWDGHDRLGMVVHPKFSDVIHKGIISLNSAIQVLSLAVYHVPGSLERKEGIVVTDLRLLSTTSRKIRVPQQLPTNHEKHNVLPHPPLAKRPHYLSMLADDLMQEVWSWKTLKKRISMDDFNVVRPTTPTLAELANSDKVELAHLAAKARVRSCMQQLSDAGAQDITRILGESWNGLSLPYSREHLEDDSIHETPLFGRVVWVTRLLYYGSTGADKEPSYKLNIRLMDASGGLEVICWGHASAFFDASLRRIGAGALIGITGYRKKKFRHHEVSLNESNPTPNIFLVREPCDMDAASSFPLLSAEDAAASYTQLLCRYPLPEYRWTAISSIHHVGNESAFGVAGLITSVGPIKRCNLDVFTRAQFLNGGIEKDGLDKTVWLTCRYITIVDYSTNEELTTLLFANSNGRRFFRIKPGSIIGISHLLLVSSGEDSPSCLTVSSPASRIFNANDLYQLGELHSKLHTALQAAKINGTEGIVPASYEHLYSLLDWVQDIEQSDLFFNVIGNPSIGDTEDLEKAPAIKLDHSTFSSMSRSISAQLKGTTLNEKQGIAGAFHLAQTLLLSVHEEIPVSSESIPSVYEGSPFAGRRSCHRPKTLSAYRTLLTSVAKVINTYGRDIVTESMGSNGVLDAGALVQGDQELPLMDLRQVPNALEQLYLLESCQVISVGRIVDFIPPEVCKLALFTKNATQATASTISAREKKITVVQAVSHQMAWLWEKCHCLLITALRLWAGIMIVEDLNRQVQVALLVPPVPTFPLKDEIPRRYNPDTRSMTDLFTDPEKRINEACSPSKAVPFAVMQHVELKDIDSCIGWLCQYLPEDLREESLLDIGSNVRQRNARLAFCMDLRNNGAQQGAFPHLETIYQLNDAGEGV